MPEFGAKYLEQKLRCLGGKQRALFALSCAERLYPAYTLQRELYEGELAAARAALDEMWNALTMDHGSDTIRYSEVADRYSEVAEEYLRGEDAEWNPLNPISDNAIAAVIYAVQCLNSGDFEAAKWAAVQAYEAADYVAHTLGDVEFGTKESETAIVQSPVVQTELLLQEEVIKTIENAASLSEAIGTLRKRSKESGDSFAMDAAAIANTAQ